MFLSKYYPDLYASKNVDFFAIWADLGLPAQAGLQWDDKWLSFTHHIFTTHRHSLSHTQTFTHKYTDKY